MRVNKALALLAMSAFAVTARAAEDEQLATKDTVSAIVAKSGKDAKGMVNGYRGFSMAVSADQVAFLGDGDRVDVLVTFDAQMKDKVKEKVTATILQNVVVVKVIKPQKLDDNKGVVQLLLNPNEAQYAALAEKQGDCDIILRKENDVEMTPMEMASFRKLFR
jgi:Flp pilus assembly protein CpaB